MIRQKCSIVKRKCSISDIEWRDAVVLTLEVSLACTVAAALLAGATAMRLEETNGVKIAI
jgi:hypothetical protein